MVTISIERAKELWLTKAIYAYDESQQVEWQVNSMGEDPSILDELEPDCVFFAE